MKGLIHDLPEKQFQRMKIENEITVIQADGAYTPCQGCFKCWLKNLGYCDMKDSLRHIGCVLGRCDELILASKLIYGGYSTSITILYLFVTAVILGSLPFVVAGYWKAKKKSEVSIYLFHWCRRFLYFGACICDDPTYILHSSR
jgi:hypothetical protein